MKKKKPDRFKYLLLLSAFMVSSVAAIFSVTGIATLFSGYFLIVGVMMGVLEFAKIVVASLLSRYWNKISKILRVYFLIATAILILITSAGIFGYLSDAYQKTKGDYTVVENKVSLLTQKKIRFQSAYDNLKAENTSIDQNVSSLISALNNNTVQVEKKDSLGRGTGEYYQTQSYTTRNLIKAQIEESKVRKITITPNINALSDSLGSIDAEIFELESKNIQGELGPLKYIAGAFGTDMDTAVKYLIFLIIFVFDPLAILLFVSVNSMIRKEKESDEEYYTENDAVSDIIVKVKEPVSMEIKEELPEEPENIIEDDIPEKVDDVEKEESSEGGVFFVDKGYIKDKNKKEQITKMIDELVETKVKKIDISKEDGKIIAEIIENPPEPNEALKNAAKESIEKEEEIKKKVEDDDEEEPEIKYLWKSSNFHPPKKKRNSKRNQW